MTEPMGERGRQGAAPLGGQRLRCRFCGSPLSPGYEGRWYCTARGCWNYNHPVTQYGVDIWLGRRR